VDYHAGHVSAQGSRHRTVTELEPRANDGAQLEQDFPPPHIFEHELRFPL
jgi:hypothetical protein